MRDHVVLRVGGFTITGGLVATLFFAVFQAGRRHALPPPPAPEHNLFYSGRRRVYVGDDKTEVEVFQDPGGTWVACVWRAGKCWRGKLQLRSGGGDG